MPCAPGSPPTDEPAMLEMRRQPRPACCCRCRAVKPALAAGPSCMCKLCRHYDAHHAGHCRELAAERVADKARANDCGWFVPRPEAYKGGGAAMAQASRSALEPCLTSSPLQNPPSQRNPICSTICSGNRPAPKRPQRLPFVQQQPCADQRDAGPAAGRDEFGVKRLPQQQAR